MAITPIQAGTIAEEKFHLTQIELENADTVEREIDILVSKVYNGQKATVSVQRPTPKVLREVRRRYEAAGWNFVTSDDMKEGLNQSGYGQNGHNQAGFSITLVSVPQKKVVV